MQNTMHKLALLCPGQGGQSSSMFALAGRHADAAAFIQRALDLRVNEHSLKQVLNSPQQIFENQYAQPLVVAATLANWLALREHLPRVELVAGYSIGEFAAHAVSGSMDALAMTSLAGKRAALMQACVQAPHAMLAVSGIALKELQAFAASHALHVAIVTAANKAIIAGLRQHVEAAIPQLQQWPGHDVSLNEIAVHIASHTPLMQAAVPGMSTLLELADWRVIGAAGVAVVAGVNGAIVTGTAQIQQSLLAQLTQTIQWDACMDGMAEKGVTLALELGPGSALSTMLQARYPHIVCRSVADFRSLDGVIQWLQRQYG